MYFGLYYNITKYKKVMHITGGFPYSFHASGAVKKTMNIKGDMTIWRFNQKASEKLLSHMYKKLHILFQNWLKAEVKILF